MRYRHKLSRLRAGLKSQIHAVLGKEGVLPQLRDLWGPVGFEFLNQTRLGDAYEIRLESLRDLIAVHDREIVELDGWIHRRLRDDAGYRVIQ